MRIERGRNWRSGLSTSTKVTAFWPKESSPTIQALKVRAVRVPMAEPHQTASGRVAESPLVLTDVITDAGVAGHSMVFTYTPAALKPTAEMIRNLEPLLTGQPLAPGAIEQQLAARIRLH